MVWIKDPHKEYFTTPKDPVTEEPLNQYCDSSNECTIDTKVAPFLGVNPIVLKRVGDFLEWSGVLECEGDNNSNLTCTIPVDVDGAPQEVTATFQ